MSLHGAAICCRGSGLCSKQKKIVRTYENKSDLMQKPREMLLSTPAGKKTLSACHALQSARIAPRPRPQSPDGLPVSTFLAFCLEVLVRRYVFENRRKNDKH